MRCTAALLACLALVDCRTMPSEPSQRTESLDAPFALGVGDEVSIPDSLKLVFRDVAQDSRCPVDVQCIRAGEAVLVFEVIVEGRAPGSLQIDVPPGGGGSGTLESYTTHVEALAPEASSTGAIEKDAYRATVRVTAAPSVVAGARPAGRVR